MGGFLLQIWNTRANTANEGPITVRFERAVCEWLDGAGGNQGPKMVEREASWATRRAVEEGAKLSIYSGNSSTFLPKPRNSAK